MDLVRITWIKNLVIRPDSLLIKSSNYGFWRTLTSSSNFDWLTLPSVRRAWICNDFSFKVYTVNRILGLLVSLQHIRTWIPTLFFSKFELESFPFGHAKWIWPRIWKIASEILNIRISRLKASCFYFGCLTTVVPSHFRFVFAKCGPTPRHYRNNSDITELVGYGASFSSLTNGKTSWKNSHGNTFWHIVDTDTAKPCWRYTHLNLVLISG